MTEPFQASYLAKSLSVVVPVYNSEGSLPLLVNRLSSILPNVAPRFELILVNDASADASGSVVDQLTAEYGWIVGIHLMRNFGQHNALLSGIRDAQFETIITLDDDLQNPPEEIPRLLVKLNEGFDVVYGFPERESHGLWRDLASRITKATLRNAMGVDVASRVSSYRAFRAQVRSAFANYHGAFVSVDVLLSWGTSQFAAIPVKNPPRVVGKSNYTVGKLIIHAVNMVTGFSVMPLQVASMLGFAFAIFGFSLLVYVLERYIVNGDTVVGFPFLASALSIFSGVQLFSLGIIGEYLARMHFRLLDKPTYTVRSNSRKNQV
jgi:undecaprenyl-phosphate 4-deoxy-4-formamido-L-arabinose transferase